jgi:single-strand DNA-binding protein
MALSLNKVMLLGHLGKDAETRFSNDNSLAISTFSLATSQNKKGKDGNWVSETTWHNIVAFSVHDWVLEGLKKGARAYVEGRIQIRDYTKQDNTPGRIIEIVAEKIQLVDKKGENDSGASFESNQSTSQSGRGQDASAATDAPRSSGKPDDDLPF